MMAVRNECSAMLSGVSIPAIHQPVRLYRLSRPISYRKLVRPCISGSGIGAASLIWRLLVTTSAAAGRHSEPAPAPYATAPTAPPQPGARLPERPGKARAGDHPPGAAR